MEGIAVEDVATRLVDIFYGKWILLWVVRLYNAQTTLQLFLCFWDSSKCDDPRAVQRVFEYTLVVPANISVGELLSLSPDYQKYNVDFCKVNRMAAYSLSPQLLASLPMATTLLTTSVPVYSLPIMELKVKVAGQFDDIGL